MAANSETIVDEDLYLEMSTPFDSPEDANTALTEFWKDVYASRKKHRLANVTIVVKDAIKNSGAFMWDAHCGNEIEQEAMAAWRFGRASADRQDLIRRASNEGLRSAIKASDHDK